MNNMGDMIVQGQIIRNIEENSQKLDNISLNLKTCIENQQILNQKIEYLTNQILSMKGQQ